MYPPSYPAYPGNWQPAPGPVPDPLISPDYSGWWQRAMAVVRTSWRQLAAVQAILAVITFGADGAIGVAQIAALRETARAAEAGEQAPLGDVFALVGLAAVGVLFAVLLYTLATVATVHIVIVAATGGRPRLASSLAGAARRLFPLIGWALLIVPLTIAGFCACILPGIYLIAVFTVLAPVVAVERGGAVSRCFRLFHGDLGASVARVATILGIWLGGLALTMVTATIGGAITDAASASTPALVISGLVDSAVAVAIFGVLGVLTGPLIVAAYADMRARVEPLSSAVLAHELAR
jgi:hypothetical protein